MNWFLVSVIAVAFFSLSGFIYVYMSMRADEIPSVDFLKYGCSMAYYYWLKSYHEGNEENCIYFESILKNLLARQTNRRDRATVNFYMNSIDQIRNGVKCK